MALLLDKEQKSTLVYGYIKIKIPSLDIPYDVIKIIDEFLVFSDRWDASYIIKDSIEINPETNSITSLGNTCTVYGEAIVDCRSMIQTWKLKILKYKGTGWFSMVGIVENDHGWLTKNRQNPRWWEERRGYGFVCGHASIIYYDENGIFKLNKYGEKFKHKDDTMEIILNVQEGSLKFVINGTDYGNVSKNLDKTKEYRLAITLRSNAKGCVIQLY